MNSLNDFKIDFVKAEDGTRIGYRTIGIGPGLILVPGSLQSSLNFTKLAKALSVNFTIYIPDRRGRGLSGGHGDKYSLLTEANDLLALVNYTKATNIFGLSAGAIITLQTILIEPAIRKIALYEPPIPLNENTFKKLNKDYESAMHKRNSGKAFIAILKGTGDVDFSLLSLLPAFITAPVINILMKSQMKTKNEEELPLQELIPTFHYDQILIEESKSLLEKVKDIQGDVLLLYGSKSQKYFKPVIDRLYTSMPKVTCFKFEKLGHLAADNSESPLKVAAELLRFFYEPSQIC